MTMPHLMNCPHREDGHCLDCVASAGEEHLKILATHSQLKADSLRAIDAAQEALASQAQEVTRLGMEVETLRNAGLADIEEKAAQRASIAALKAELAARDARVQGLEQEMAQLRFTVDKHYAPRADYEKAFAERESAMAERNFAREDQEAAEAALAKSQAEGAAMRQVLAESAPFMADHAEEMADMAARWPENPDGAGAVKTARLRVSRIHAALASGAGQPLLDELESLRKRVAELEREASDHTTAAVDVFGAEAERDSLKAQLATSEGHVIALREALGPFERWPVVYRFAQEMIRKLDHHEPKKGGREGWVDDSPFDLATRVNQEVAELHAALPVRSPEEVLAEAADVANMVMMVADAREPSLLDGSLASPSPQPTHWVRVEKLQEWTDKLLEAERQNIVFRETLEHAQQNVRSLTGGDERRIAAALTQASVQPTHWVPREQVVKLEAALRGLRDAVSMRLARGEDTTPGDFEYAWKAACDALDARAPVSPTWPLVLDFARRMEAKLEKLVELTRFAKHRPNCTLASAALVSAYGPKAACDCGFDIAERDALAALDARKGGG